MRLSLLCLPILLTMASLDGDTRVRTAAATTADASIDRFLNGREAPLASAIVRRHMVATTRGGSMTAWLDAWIERDMPASPFGDRGGASPVPEWNTLETSSAATIEIR